jgi:type I restriction enzyme M protein
VGQFLTIASGSLFHDRRQWAAADQLRANSGLTAQQYSQPVLGLIFLRFAEVRFAARRSELEKGAASGRRGSRVEEPNAYLAEGVLYLSPTARFDYLLALPEGEAVGKAVTDAMREVQVTRWRHAGPTCPACPGNLRSTAS